MPTPAAAPLSRAQRALFALLTAVWVLGALGCGDPSEPLIGSWTLAASASSSDGDMRWQFNEDGTFVYDDFRSDRAPSDGLWQRDGDSVRLEWRTDDGELWPEEFVAYVDDRRLALYAFLDENGGDSGVAGDYVGSWFRYLPDGELFDARRDWILLIDDGTAVVNGINGSWTEGEMNEMPYVSIGLEIDGVLEEYGYFVVADGVLSYRVYEREPL